jgi:hypothetical protein
MKNNGTRIENNGTRMENNGTREENNGTREENNDTREENNGTRTGNNGTRIKNNGTRKCFCSTRKYISGTANSFRSKVFSLGCTADFPGGRAKTSGRAFNFRRSAADAHFGFFIAAEFNIFVPN